MSTLNKIKSVKLCLISHPDNEQDSEFADRISNLEEIEANFSEMFEMLKMLYDENALEYQFDRDAVKQLLTKITEQ